MKNKIFAALLFSFSILLHFSFAISTAANLINEYVKDPVDVLNENDEKVLEAELRKIAAEKDLHIKITTVFGLNLDTEPENMIKFAVKELVEWKPEEKNRLVIALALDDREIRIEPWPESPITAEQSDAILKNAIIPLFEQDKWLPALQLGINELARQSGSLNAQGYDEYASLGNLETEKDNSSFGFILGGILVVVWGVIALYDYTRPKNIEARRVMREIEKRDKERVRQEKERERVRLAEEREYKRKIEREQEHQKYLALRKAIEAMPQYEIWRQAVLTKFGRKCAMCGSAQNLEVDHRYQSFHSIIKKHSITNTTMAYECAALWDVNNGAPLCKTHYDETTSSKYRQSKMETSY